MQIDYFNTPIVINNYNRLTLARDLYKSLVKLGYTNIIILDNNSTYPPLLDFYRSLKGREHVKVEFLKENLGHKALWKSAYIDKLKDWEYIAYTDCDLQLNLKTPKNFIETLIKVSKELKFDKVGLAIKINDLPNNFLGKIIRGTESIYWINKLQYRSLELYQGMIDTTFAVIKPSLPFQYSAIRIAGDFTCVHAPWYSDFANLSKEELFFIESSDKIVSTYAQHYLNHLKENENQFDSSK